MGGILRTLHGSTVQFSNQSSTSDPTGWIRPISATVGAKLNQRQDDTKEVKRKKEKTREKLEKVKAG
eukprot:3358180-Karenia_brevis.AAC.1